MSERKTIYLCVEEWREAQGRLTAALRELERMQGNTPEMEARLLLEMLKGYAVVVRNPQLVDGILERAERVLPLLSDPLLKCKLAAYCYREVPDEELLEMVCSLIAELKHSGHDDEVLQLEQMIWD